MNPSHPPASQTTPDAPPERDARGRFAAGNRGGPGNPFARQVARLRAALVQRVTEADMEQIADDLIVQAKTGNLAATKLLFQYVLGKPAETVGPDTLDIQEWEQVYRPLPRIMQELPAAMQTLPARTACDMVETAQPFVGDALGATLRRPQEELEKMANERANDAKEAKQEQEAAASNSTPTEEQEEEAPPSANGRNGRSGHGQAAPEGEPRRGKGQPSPSANGGHGEMKRSTAPIPNGRHARRPPGP